MAFDLAVYESHLRGADSAHNPLARYDALWKAFNQFYESFYAASDGRNPKEWELIHRAVGRVPAHKLGLVVDAACASGMADMDLVFDERMWNRFEHRAEGRHSRVKAIVARRTRGEAVGVADVEQVADLLYVVRCNAAHGFKTPDGPRDLEVLDAATPVLRALLDVLPVGLNVQGSAAAEAG